MDPSDPAIARALRKLTIAVWALVLVVALALATYLAALVPWLMSSWNAVDMPRSAQSSSRHLPRYERFYDLPLEKQIEAASVIALGRYQKDGEKLKCVISEILKQSPNTEFYFKVGDEYPHCSRYPKADEVYGDGQLMFFVGNPAEFRFSTSFAGDRLGGLGEMPIEVMRAKIKSEAK